jgi:cell wall assembly regulator SMI1
MNIEELTKHFISWHGRTGANSSEIKQAEYDLGVRLPGDYKSFLLWSNGGEGAVGDAYLSLWEVGRLKELNEMYRIRFYLPHCLGIGTDGGGECYALDFRHDPENPVMIQVPLGDLDYQPAVTVGNSFQGWLEKTLQS